MDNEDICAQVLEANKQIYEHGLAPLTWGNASGFDNNEEKMYIKPSGLPFQKLTRESIVAVHFDGRVESTYKPSVDTPMHLVLYREFRERKVDITSIVHTHSPYATAFAQVKRDIPCLGTTNADYFSGIRVIPDLSQEQIKTEYEANLGKKIIEFLFSRSLLDKAVLLPSHGIVTWGRNVKEAVVRAIAVEEIAKIEFLTLTLGKALDVKPNPDPRLLFKHYQRMQGPHKYYGQGEQR